ncbi:L,D-transpeptidase family protein [Epibacterium sp. SM1979]|uniref:L,D-transpeptidase family protein n=1 Tax=Tritonibacter litoralis TaxID=2662264 RepID=A0A843Y8A8_9RHOB|nr:L,D-transpeptidase family protein [Tritonibacter litoralis]MQQ07106.1 L,D-transpeptidase family protein [Tritonibacter litoralis]
MSKGKAPAPGKLFKAGLFALALGGFAISSTPATAQVTAFKQSLAEAASSAPAVAAFYRKNGFDAIWTGSDDASKLRRKALFRALEDAPVHGLPDQTDRIAELMAQLKAVRTTRDLGEAEAALSKAFVEYARDMKTGLLVPSRIDDGMVRKKAELEADVLLAGLKDSQPSAFMRSLVPDSAQYRSLMREKLRLEQIATNGGWGRSVPNGKYEPGDQGAGVIALRNRLIAMGFLERSASATYDAALANAVLDFQASHGLEQDGVAGEGTIKEVNVTARERLKSIIVAMERERWLAPERGTRHVLVNQTDFSAKIVDDGEITFQTRSVIGKNTGDRRSPEFSDVMEHMVINPSWYVPRSIITKEYLPKLRANPNAVSHLQITDNRGRVVNRGSVDFSQYTARSFPFAMKQPPSTRNALGLVKFMFPNKYNIYLHDTPEKHLFSREVRAFSHGCIRLHQPFEFAYALLAKQTEDPEAFFQRILKSGRETKVDLKQHVPVHIIYRTAFVPNKGPAEFRRDVYGRDAKVWAALERAGVALPSVQG